MKHLLGIDLGTTGLKVSLFTQDGNLLASQSCEYPLSTPQPGFVEQDPDDWWHGFVGAAQKLKSSFPDEFASLAGIGLCGQMHTQVYLDENDHILRPAITWMDQRSSAIVARIQNDPIARQLIYDETANYASTTYTAPQVKWVQENQPEIWNKTRSILIAKDYLKYRLTGVKATDYAEASGSLLFDVRQERWSQAAFDYFGIPPDYFPDVYPSDHIIGQVQHPGCQGDGHPSRCTGRQRQLGQLRQRLGGRDDPLRSGYADHRHSWCDLSLLRSPAAGYFRWHALLALLLA